MHSHYVKQLFLKLRLNIFQYYFENNTVSQKILFYFGNSKVYLSMIYFYFKNSKSNFIFQIPLLSVNKFLKYINYFIFNKKIYYFAKKTRNKHYINVCDDTLTFSGYILFSKENNSFQLKSRENLSEICNFNVIFVFTTMLNIMEIVKNS